MRSSLIAALLILIALPAYARPGLMPGSSGEFTVTTPPGSTVTTFDLEAPTTATLPFTIGMTFVCGEVPSAPSIDVANSQAEVLARCNDNSARLVQFAGRASFTSGVPLTVTVSNTPAVEGADLTPSDIDAANPAMSVSLGGYGSSSLASLDLTDPKKIWSQGPEMIEAEYQDAVGDFWINYYVRLYADGRVRGHIVVETGRFGAQVLATSFQKDFVPSVSIGGATVWNNGGSSYTQHEWTGWHAIGWIGGDPAVEYAADTAMFSESRMLPPYWKTGPSETALNALASSYTPGSNGNQWAAGMGAAGYSPGIGVQPNDVALWVTSGGDARARDAIEYNTRSLSSYAVSFNDENTGETVLPSDRPTWTLGGAGGGAGDNWSTGGGLTYDIPHHPAASAAYTITTDPAYYKIMRNVAALCYLSASSGFGSGVSRIFYGQDRARAWCVRSLAVLSANARADDPIAQEYKTLLANNITAQKNEVAAAGNDLGFFYYYSSSTPIYSCYSIHQDGSCNIGPFMYFFWIASLGYLDEMDVLADETDLHLVRDFINKVVIGLGGPGGADAFCYNTAVAYRVTVSDQSYFPAGTYSAIDTTAFYSDGATSAWKQAYDKTCSNTAEPVGCDPTPSDCNATLRGTSAGAPSAADYGYWGNYLTALGYCALYDDECVTALNRIKAASNWATIANIPADISVWAIGDPADFN